MSNLHIPTPLRVSSPDRTQYVYAVQILYCLALYTAKLSILLQIKRIFEGTQQRKAFIFWASWVLIVALSCVYTSTLMVLVFSCTPVRKVSLLSDEDARVLTQNTGLEPSTPRQMPQLCSRLHLWSHQPRE